MIKLSVIVPVYNEEKTVLEILRRVRAQKIEGVSIETIVVDDCSKDGTVAQLKAHPELYTTLIRHETNGGKGAAVRSGLRAATGDYVLFQDADLEYDPADYVNLLYPVLQLKADVVMGSRVLAPRYLRIFYLTHRLGNQLITFIFNVLFNKTFSDVYTCYLLFRTELVKADELRTSGWEQQAEILAKCVRRSLVHYDVPISYHGRTYGEGKKIRAHHVISVIWTMFRERFMSYSGTRWRDSESFSRRPSQPTPLLQPAFGPTSRKPSRAGRDKRTKKAA